MAVVETEQVGALVEAARTEQRGLWRDAWRRLKQNPAALAGAAYVLIMLVIAIVAPLLAPYNLARDELSRLLYGARVSMIVGFIPTAIVTLIGTTIGLLSGWLGGRWDNLMMRFVDVMYAFPTFLFFIILQASLRQTWFGQLLGGLMLLFFAFAVTGWVDLTRLVRGQVLSVKEQEFIEGARALGVSTPRILLRYILPNSLAPIIVFVAFSIPSYILAEAGLSFLGLGVQPPTSGWGSMVFDSFPQMTFQPIFVILPSVLIAFIMVAFTFVGDGLRDALDPRMSR